MNDPRPVTPEHPATTAPSVLLGIAGPTRAGTAPCEPSTPARHLAEWMRRAGATDQDVADATGLPVDTVRGLVAGTLPVDVAIAAALHRATDTDAGLWIALQAYTPRRVPRDAGPSGPSASEDRPRR